MNILVDGRAFCASSAGISTVLRCVLQSWGNQYPKEVLYVILPKERVGSIRNTEFPPNVKWLESKSLVFKYLPNLVYLLLMVPYYIFKYKISVYYTPVPCLPFFIPKKVKTIIEINDVVNLEYKDTMAWSNKLANALLFNRSMKKADVIWSISEYTKKKVEEYFPKRRCNEIFVGCATDRTLYKKLDISLETKIELKNKFGVKDKFILFVGSLEPRKNLPFLLDIIPEIYREAGIQLVVVGAKGWKNSAIRTKVMDALFPQESTIFCGFVPNEELVMLYNIADCFVSSSLNEGFGLPQLEAFLCGCPVITSANSAMIEVAESKKGGYLIEGYNKEEWIKKIINVVREQPSVDIHQFDKYNWDSIVKELRKSRIEES
ncbi:Glycosyltransferase involved in cell wall bisynthesis [Prevotella sp. ne3005]|uniref:glycosyltransferase family 4 protein n=1 Tax=Prevotella sp. ne3005 TaxID=1761887 RepID=UPI0008C6A250|nr:glycosyltransferase family 1 protein [Prevotella sp. ne3005]SEM54329.1 Glycosyltransferase involved in cell wall bisynthesis [Prevotella sp. ne3005]